MAVPTLVLHSRRDARVPFEHGQMLAQAIPNARFVALESRNHLILFMSRRGRATSMKSVDF